MTNAINETVVMEALREVMDPEIGCNIVDLGLIYSVAIEGARVKVTMTLTTPGCPMSQMISEGAQWALLGLDGVEDVSVEVVWEPRWNPAMMSDAARKLVGYR